jgi:SAM-dependent methyltransferase
VIDSSPSQDSSPATDGAARAGPSTDLSSSPTTRWEEQVVGERWTFYTDRFDQMTADGTDLEGEARFVDAMLSRHSAVLDAGCGTGRIAAGLQRMGHRSVGVDKDAGLIEIAVSRYPGVPYLACDLLLLDSAKIESIGGPATFDVIALPGNVMVYLATGSEQRVLSVLAGLLRPAGRIVAGFATNREYSVKAFCSDAEAAGLVVEHHFATWQLGAVSPDSDWAVIVLRGPGQPEDDPNDRTKWTPATNWPRGAE